MNKKRIANEWLIFIGCVVFGATLFPLLLFVLLADGNETNDFYQELGRGNPKAWIALFAPYLLIQIIRSIAWALRTSKAND